MQAINMIMIYYWDKKLKRLHAQKVIKKNRKKRKEKLTDWCDVKLKGCIYLFIFLFYLRDMFQMTTIELVSERNNYINGLHLFRDTLY